MSLSPSAGALSKINLEIARACELLVSATPDALANCGQPLELALSALRALRSQAAESVDETSLQALRSEILRARRLLENLHVFSAGWARILATMTGGYTANGEPVPLARLGRLECSG